MFIYRLSTTYLSKKSNFSPKCIIFGNGPFWSIILKKSYYIFSAHVHQKLYMNVIATPFYEIFALIYESIQYQNVIHSINIF